MIEDNTQGNPDTLPANADEQVFGSDGDNFFDSLEQNVNSMVQDDTPVTEAEVTPAQQGSNNVTAQAEVSQDTDLDNIKKRYSDSSREAQNLRAQLNEL